MNITLKKIIRAVLVPAFLFTPLSCLFAAGVDLCAGETLFRSPYENGPFVELLIKHVSGKTAGYDKKTGRVISGIAGSCYAEQGLGSNPTVKNLVMAEPLEGRHTLYVQANESGIYVLQADILTKQETVSSVISGLVAGGDIQEIEAEYTGGDNAVLSVRKKVDVYLLKREIEMALKKGGLHKGLGKELVRDLIHLERALMNKAGADARKILKEFISKLANRQETFAINNKKDVETWFKTGFIENPDNVPEVILKKEQLFLNINNINDKKKAAWFEARSVNILLEDAKILFEDIKQN
jgi:hypothetical protein